MTAMWFDTHCHLDAAEFDADRDAVIGQATAAGVTRIVVPAVEVGNFAAVAALCSHRTAAIPGGRCAAPSLRGCENIADHAKTRHPGAGRDPCGALVANKINEMNDLDSGLRRNDEPLEVQRIFSQTLSHPTEIPSGHNSQKNGMSAAAALRLLPAYGIHPMYTPRAEASDLQVLRDWLQARLDRRASPAERPVAVGEIGLDGFVPGLDMARQEAYFAGQLKLAVEFNLPVILHIRRAQDLVLKHLRRYQSYFRSRGPGRAGVAHAFNGSRQQADTFIGLGFVLGFGGAMTYEGSSRIRKLAAELPLDSMVLETDAPDIAPAWLAGRRNTPAEVPRIARVLAELRGVAPDSIAVATGQNATRLFAES